MKTALLIYWYNTNNTNQNGWNWETPNEKVISTHKTKHEALLNKPEGYKHEI